MKILSVFRKKRVRWRKDSYFRKALTRGGYPKEILEVIRMKDKTVWNVIGIVFVQERRIFVTWERTGLAYVCHERAVEFDLLL
nr:hypothetical protein [uncultured Butyricimonas sp.]